MLVTHRPHTTHTYFYLYTNTPQPCPCAHCTPPHTQTHTIAIYITSCIQKIQPSQNTSIPPYTSPPHTRIPHTTPHLASPPTAHPTSTHLFNTYSHLLHTPLIHTLTSTAPLSLRNEPCRGKEVVRRWGSLFWEVRRREAQSARSFGGGVSAPRAPVDRFSSAEEREGG